MVVIRKVIATAVILSVIEHIGRFPPCSPPSDGGDNRCCARTTQDVKEEQDALG